VGELEVEVTTLDRLIKRYGVPKFIKIDVEGYELNALRGLSYRIPFITIEYHSDQRSIAATRECISRLSSFGPVEINATAENNHDLVLPYWLERREFLDQFPDCVAHHSYGDLIIKAKNYAAYTSSSEMSLAADQGPRWMHRDQDPNSSTCSAAVIPHRKLGSVVLKRDSSFPSSAAESCATASPISSGV
jgi:hypothetical protein